MADSDSLIIRAEMIGNIVEEAARDREAIKAMTESIRSSTADMVTSIDKLGDRLDSTHQRTVQAASGGTKLKKAYDDLYESGGKLREGFSSLGESIRYRVQYPMQQLTYTMEGAAAGMVTFGLVTESSLQQGQLALTNLTGSATIATGALAQLRSMQGAVGLSQLEGGYSSLFQAGMSPGQILPTLKGLSGLSAVSGNPNQAMQGMSSALASMQSTGLLTTSDVQAFSGANVDVWGILAKETGQTPEELRLRFLRAGTPMAVPATFTSDLMALSGARGGSAAYDRTWAGQMEQTKKAAGDLLAVIETPLGNALSGAGQKIDTWAQATEGRFKVLGSSLGKEWSSGDTKGFSTTLATILGDPKLAGGIDTTVRSLKDLGNIFEHSVVPAGKDLAKIATPALHGLADVLDVMAQHKSATEGLIGMFGGFLILSKVARSFSAATTAIGAFSAVMESQGMIAAFAQWEKGLLGIASAQAAVASSADAEAASEALATGAGGLGGIAGMAGKLGLAAGAGYIGYKGMSSKHLTLGSGLETVGGDAAAGALVGSAIPVIGTGLGALFGGAVGAGAVAGRLFGGGGHHVNNSTNIRTINITVPGSGNPQKVTNAMAKGLNAQIVAQQQRTDRRGG